MSYTIGQKVVFLHEIGSGVIKSINAFGQYVIDDNDGFERTYSASDIAPVLGEDYKVDDDDIAIIKEDSSKIRVQHRVNKEMLTGRRKPIDVWEIDLHAHEIMETEKGLSNAVILKRQMSAFRIFFDKARSKTVRKLIVIHGVGEGVLKFEVRSLLDRVDGVAYYDSDFQEYGKGATTIEISYNY